MNFSFRPWYHDLIFWEIFLLDWVSKWIAVDNFYRPLKITSFLSLKVSINRGISWSLFSGNDTLTFVIISSLVFGILCFLAYYTLERQKEEYDVLGETLLLAGGFSNFIDRLIYGGVIDFISISWGGWSFPIFNIADIVISIGVMVIIYRFLFGEPEE